MPEKNKHLVIVESPAKARTISQFLGKDYTVLASMGHVRDLPKSKMGIDTENGFEAEYILSPDKKKTVKMLSDALKKAENLWIATDEDREGEAIGWHLLNALKVNPGKIPVKRIVFHEITKKAIEDSLKHPRNIDDALVEAQQTRRILDRLVGYELSPLLWKKVKPGLSAGRVQSVAVRLVVEREREIQAFIPEEYWKIIANLEKDSSLFQAELKYFKGEKLVVRSEEQTKEILAAVENADFIVEKVEEKEVVRNPAAPFITSTLQQEASRKLGFSVQKTMRVAQQLYEGINTGKSTQGLITYMRTDSVNLSDVALKAAKEVITAQYGAEFALDKPRKYKGKKGAQEAHEAIRPVDMSILPAEAAKFLDRDQSRLYELIWKRTVACQMKQAILNRVAVDIDAHQNGVNTGYRFRANGQTIVFPGFMEVYMEGKDIEDDESPEGERLLPMMKEGEALNFKELLNSQHFTKPPARYTEASLVKKLEEEGIGRPSTYAPVISTIQQRGYVRKEGKQLAPEDIAYIVIDLLINHFPEIVDIHFTAEMEQSLDDIADGEKKRVEFLKAFYQPFHKLVEDKTGGISRQEVMKEREVGLDKKTGLTVIARFGRFGPYVQLGRLEDMEGIDDKEKKKKLKTASLPKDLSIDDVTVEQAMELLAFPKEVGKHKGESVVVTQGPYGPYLKWGKKNVSLPENVSILDVDLVTAVDIIENAEKQKKEMKKAERKIGKDPVSGGEIVIKVGRFGPYVTDGKINAAISKKLDPATIDLDTAAKMLEKKRKK